MTATAVRIPFSATSEQRITGTIAPVMRALGIAIGVIRSLMFAGLLATIVLIAAGAAPSLFGHESFVVYSGSMEPALPVGSIAVVRPVPVSQLRPGDVVTYRTPAQPEMVVTHRVVAIESGEDRQPRLRTKGDANATEDVVQVDTGAVLGKVVYGVPFAGYVVEFTRQPAVRLLLLGVPAVFFVVSWLASGLRRSSTSPATRDAQSSVAVDVDEADRPAPAVVGAPAPPSGPARVSNAADLEQAIERLLPLPLGPATSGEAGDGPLGGMVEAARAALARGDAAAAARAAEGVLAVDPRNEGAWLVKAETEPDAAARARLLQSALLVNPGSARLAAALRALQPSA